MKKIAAILLALVMVLPLVACGESQAKAMTEIEQCAQFAVLSIKERMIDPSSMTVNHLQCVEADEGYIFSVDVSAKNKVGGVARNTYYIHVSKTGDNSYTYSAYGAADFMDDESQKYTKQFYEKYSTKGYHSFNSETFREY